MRPWKKSRGDRKKNPVKKTEVKGIQNGTEGNQIVRNREKWAEKRKAK